MPSFKFHIVTVISIFVALALGIMVGSTLSDGIISNSQMNTIDLMQSRITLLEEKNKGLETDIQEMKLAKTNLKARERDYFYKTLEQKDYSMPITLVYFDEQDLLTQWNYYLENINLSINEIAINPDMEEEVYKQKLSQNLDVEVDTLYTILGKQTATGIKRQEFSYLTTLKELNLATFTGEEPPGSRETYVFFFQGDHYDNSLAELANTFVEEGLSVIIALDEEVEDDFVESLNYSAIIVENINQSTGLLEVLKSIN
ncbi:copper transporter [Proteinivorax tanatarense]|uniref:Copper transporter n=1 Tax=Proteinivorax tanatarense TaxID=1260629 RepID=A0AAU7VPE5_9FIRM